MDEHLIRLAWALPLVLLVGLGAVWALKRVGIGMSDVAATEVPVVASTTVLSEHTRLMVVIHRGRELLVVESTASVQVLAPQPPTVPAASGWFRPLPTVRHG